MWKMQPHMELITILPLITASATLFINALSAGLSLLVGSPTKDSFPTAIGFRGVLHLLKLKIEAF